MNDPSAEGPCSFSPRVPDAKRDRVPAPPERPFRSATLPPRGAALEARQGQQRRHLRAVVPQGRRPHALAVQAAAGARRRKTTKGPVFRPSPEDSQPAVPPELYDARTEKSGGSPTAIQAPLPPLSCRNLVPGTTTNRRYCTEAAVGADPSRQWKRTESAGTLTWFGPLASPAGSSPAQPCVHRSNGVPPASPLQLSKNGRS